MADMAASVLARLKNKLSALSTAFLPGGVFTTLGKVRVC